MTYQTDHTGTAPVTEYTDECPACGVCGGPAADHGVLNGYPDKHRYAERAAYIRDYTGTAPVTTHNDRPLTPVCGHYRHWADCDCGAAPDADLGHWDFEQCDVCGRPVCFAYSCPSGWDWVGITLMCRSCAGREGGAK